MASPVEMWGTCRDCGRVLMRPVLPNRVLADGVVQVVEPMAADECPCRHVKTCACPRCGGVLVVGFGACSRVTIDRGIEVCDHCGEDEADRDERGLAPVPPSEWPVSSISVRMRLYTDAMSVGVGALGER